MENDKLLVKFLGAFFIGLLAEVILLFLYFGVYGHLDIPDWSFFLLIAVSIITVIAVIVISDKSPDMEISKVFGIAQGAAMIIPALWVGNLGDYPVAFTVLFAIAFVFYICGTIDIYKKDKWNGSFRKLTLSFMLQSVYAFAFATLGAFVFALLFVLSGGGRRRKKHRR